MLRIIALPDADAPAAARLAAALHPAGAALPGAVGCWAAPVATDATINAGDVVWRLVFASEADALRAPATLAWRTAIAPLLAQVQAAGAQITGVGYRMIECAVRATGPGLWRALVFRVMPHAPAAAAARLEAALPRLPHHVAAIRAWSLNRVAWSEGPRQFSHVWEQEFAALDGLTGPYMTDPAHWGLADAFFDAEDPDYIVDPYLIQVIGAIDAGILTALPGSAPPPA